ncbi:helix-turn-helix domain-containing protein [Streptomyces sp. M10(2022)]
MTVELLGDRWSLIVLRDIMFGGSTHFRELLSASIEGIASNILAARLAKLVKAGLLTRDDDPSHRQKVEYHLTEAAIQLVPVMAQLGAWGARWLDTTPELTVRAELLAAGGPAVGAIHGRAPCNSSGWSADTRRWSACGTDRRLPGSSCRARARSSCAGRVPPLNSRVVPRPADCPPTTDATLKSAAVRSGSGLPRTSGH